MFEFMDILGGLVVGLIIGYMLWKKSAGGLTSGEVLETLRETPSLATEVIEVSKMAALAAEEYQRKKILTTSEEKLKFAMNVFRKWIPLASGVDDVAMLEAIHAAVPIARSLGVNIQIEKEPLSPPIHELKPIYGIEGEPGAV